LNKLATSLESQPANNIIPN